MYQVGNQLIRSSDRDFQYQAPNIDWSTFAEQNRNFLAAQEREYKRTEDLYDLQQNEAANLDTNLQGLSGQDYVSMQQSIVDARNSLKQAYKGRSLKDINTPEFQAQLYAIKSGLGGKRNKIDTFHAQAGEADKIVNSTPSLRKKEWGEYMAQQMNLPPEKRDTDLVTKIQSDPLFFNPYDHTVSILSKLKTADRQLEKENKDLILNYDAKYYPDLGSFTDAGEFERNPSDALVDQMLQSDKRFYNSMAGMLNPKQSNELINSGNHSAFEKAVRGQAKEYIKTVNGFDPDLKQTGKTVKTWKYYQPNGSAKKEQQAQEEVNAIQQRLLNGDERAFDDFIGDKWNGFTLNRDNEGNVISVTAMSERPHDLIPFKKVVKEETFDVDPNDSGDVAKVINIIKTYGNKDKKGITAKPLKKPSEAPKKKGRFDL